MGVTYSEGDIIKPEEGVGGNELFDDENVTTNNM